MLTTEPTPELVAEWKRIFENRRADLKPNRKPGTEVDAYFREHYPHQPLNNAELRDMFTAEIAENDFLREKTPEGMRSDIRCYSAENAIVVIDINSGEFHIEGEDINKASLIYDDLFAFRGLDENDLNNFFLVAEYVKLTER